MKVARKFFSEIGLAITVPKANDPRVIILCYFSLLIYHALTFQGFARTIDQFAVSVSTCLLLDAAYQYFLFRKLHIPMSGIVSSMGVFLLTDADGVTFYFLNAVLSISSKYLFRIQDRHIFNPNNFGIVVLLVAFPEYVSINPSRWGGGTEMLCLLFLLGFSIAAYTKRASVSFSYYATFCAGAFVRSSILGVPFLNVLTPLLGSGMQL